MPERVEISIKQITDAFNDEVEERETVSHKRMGWMLRERLQLKTQRREQGYVVSLPDNAEKITALKEKYGMGEHGEQGSLKAMSVGGDGGGEKH